MTLVKPRRMKLTEPIDVTVSGFRIGELPIGTEVELTNVINADLVQVKLCNGMTIWAEAAGMIPA
jgi:hypothetical protein